MDNSEPKILHLTLKKEYFDQIKGGEKTSEYRLYKPYWVKRLMNKDGTFRHYDLIHFRNGYNANAPKIANTAPPIVPSQVFFGEIRSKNLCFPNNIPIRYAKVSFIQINRKNPINKLCEGDFIFKSGKKRTLSTTIGITR